ncbi:transporter suffix domain-containing protein [Chryseobacterium sp.]|uniref:transporter suffix domain-containing protein n=1 Tax=Chryseobacterium sp. TaxID=1871047 RepID=UPI0025B8B805|nr:transporter suffix domain-containing protein [Chryseobacterium sp.]MBV8327247.1 transporter suffix domain-containing protein [Chryseobacterium sp.]
MSKEKLKLKHKLGSVFLGSGIICLAGVPALSFLDFPNKAATILVVLITGETLFLITITLSGKGYLEKIQQFIRWFFFFRKKKK